MNLCVAIILIVGIWHVNVYVGRIKCTSLALLLFGSLEKTLLPTTGKGNQRIRFIKQLTDVPSITHKRLRCTQRSI